MARLRDLTSWEIKKLMKGAKVKSLAVDNFLGTMGNDYYTASANAEIDARLYSWNAATVAAIRKGIAMASKPEVK